MFGLILAHIRAARGAACLDQSRPGWHNSIDTDRLNISSPEDCVIGQLTGRYGSQGCHELDIPYYQCESEKLGFIQSEHVDGQLLTRAWRRQIKRRKPAWANRSKTVI